MEALAWRPDRSAIETSVSIIICHLEQTLQSFFFGTSPQKLYGTINRATSQNSGALICTSWGPEAQASHRVLNVLAARLAEAGTNAMRFDYYGCGDSYGSGMDVSLQSLSESTHSAIEEIRDSEQVSELSVIGYRLGAIPALKIANDSMLPVVLIDPVLDGRTWLTELRSGIFSPMRKSGDMHEAGGYCASQNFIDELESTNVEISLAQSAQVSVIISSANSGVKLPPDCDIVLCESRSTWLLTGGVGLAPIPVKLIDTVVTKVRNSVQP